MTVPAVYRPPMAGSLAKPDSVQQKPCAISVKAEHANDEFGPRPERGKLRNSEAPSLQGWQEIVFYQFFKMRIPIE